ncbi:NDP-hexose 2,3-dehydratase family protein [Actinomadura miaoliensis]
MLSDSVKAAPALRSREDAAAAALLAPSAAAGEGAHPSTADFDAWFAGRAAAGRYQVRQIPFGALRGWSFEEGTGDLRHETGRFFSVEGLHVALEHDWYQPILHQPEVGVLGLLAKRFGGELHFLMQAKMEPGNPNLVQLSPTVQATYSNYTRVHRGKGTRYLEYFVGNRRGRVLADALQSELGWWFYRKSNRNMVVEVTDEVAVHEDYRWVTLGQLGELMRRDLLLAMDTRSVLSCLPVPRRERGALLTDVELLSWLTEMRSRRHPSARLVPLARTPGWRVGESSIGHEDGRCFRVVAVSVEADRREVSRWTQPLLEPPGQGVAGFLSRTIDGVRHVLVHARVEPGLVHTVELGPTAQWTPGDHARLTGQDEPPFLDALLTADPARIRYEAVHSEEGGRFRNADSRYLVVEADETQAPLDPPPGYQWVTPGQLTWLLRHGHYVTMEARTLMAGLNLGSVR